MKTTEDAKDAGGIRMRLMNLAVVAVTAAMCVSAGAQTKKPVKVPEPQVVDEGGSPKASTEMMKLAKWFVGSWTTTENYEPNDMLPNGGTGTGHETIKPGPGGLTLISDYSSTGAMGKFAGHGILYWNDAVKSYGSFWCDNLNPVCEATGTGTWEGDDLIFRGETGPQGKRVAMEQKFSRIGSDSFLFELSVADGSGAMRKSMTVEYRRVKR